MKYDIKQAESKNSEFKPFDITITIETREEYIRFHNKIMGKITNASQHKFHAAVYNAGRGIPQASSSGTI